MNLTHQQEVMRDFLLEASDELIKTPRVKSFVRRTYTELPINPKFYTAPCSGSGKNHPPENNAPGGIPVHSIKAGHAASRIAHYLNTNDIIRDCAVAAALVHDIHKNGHPEWGARTSYQHPITAAECLEELADEHGLSKPERTMIVDSVKYHMRQWGPNPERATKPVLLKPSAQGQSNPRAAELIVQTSDYLSSRKRVSTHPKGRLENWPDKGFDEMSGDLVSTIDDLITNEGLNKEAKRDASFLNRAYKNVWEKEVEFWSDHEVNNHWAGTSAPPEIKGRGGLTRLAVKNAFLADELARLFGHKTLHCPRTGERLEAYECPECGEPAEERTTVFGQQAIHTAINRAYTPKKSKAPWGFGEFRPMDARYEDALLKPRDEGCEEAWSEYHDHYYEERGEGMLVQHASTNAKMKYLMSELATLASKNFSFYPGATTTGYPGEVFKIRKQALK